MNTLRKLILIAAIPSLFLAGAAVQRFYGLGNLVAISDVVPAPEPVDLAEREVDIFLLIGQSNMEGSGSLEGYQPPANGDRIFHFGPDYQTYPAREPLRGGVGPSVAFASHYLEGIDDSDRAVLLINAARGGTNIEQWGPSNDDRSLYAKAVKRALAASHAGTIRGVLFFQGENDSEGKPTDHADDWDAQFADLVASLRSELGNPELPVVFAQIGQNVNDNPRWASVQERQAAVDLPGVAMIKTDDIDYKQGVHYSTAGYLEIGRRFADAYLKSTAN